MLRLFLVAHLDLTPVKIPDSQGKIRNSFSLCRIQDRFLRCRVYRIRGQFPRYRNHSSDDSSVAWKRLSHFWGETHHFDRPSHYVLVRGV